MIKKQLYEELIIHDVIVSTQGRYVILKISCRDDPDNKSQ